MRLLLIRRLQLALLCLILAPWQSFAGSSAAGEFAATPTVEHCQHHTQHTRAPSRALCSMCCCAALPSAMMAYWAAHHTMNAMSHSVPTMLGVEQNDLAQKISTLLPGYMNMDMGGAGPGMAMNMPLPANTLPMMTGQGPYGNIEMGGMFTVMKIRADLAHDDYRDPGWFKAPPGSVARLWAGTPPPAERNESSPDAEHTAAAPYAVQKPGPMEH